MHWETDTIRRSILTHSYLLNEIWEPREVLCTSNTVLASGCLSKNKQVSPNFAWFRQVRQRSIGHVKWCETSCVQSSALTWGDMSSDGPWNCNVTPMSLVLTPHCLCSSQVCHGLEIFDVNLAHSFAKTPRCDLNWPQLIWFLSPWIVPLCVSWDAICCPLTPLPVSLQQEHRTHPSRLRSHAMLPRMLKVESTRARIMGVKDGSEGVHVSALARTVGFCSRNNERFCFDLPTYGTFVAT